MTMLPTYIQELDFEGWLEQSQQVERVTDVTMSHFAKALSLEEDRDSYATSPAYYAFTGRRGLWLYHYQGTYLPLCWHPNIEGQILIFPPRGQKSYVAITTLLAEAPVPPTGFLLARFKSEDVSRLKTFHGFLNYDPYELIEEKVLDWRYPVRVLSTKGTKEMQGHKYMLIRNRVRQTQKYRPDVQRLSLKHIPEIETLSYRWANQQAEKPEEFLDLVAPYKQTLKLLRNKTFGLDGLVFAVDGQIQAATIWDISNSKHRTANLFMNLCNVTYRGLSEFSIAFTAERLLSDGVQFLNLGGSETLGLDRYKNKFAPEFSLQLCSLKPKIKSRLSFIEGAGVAKRT